MMVFVRARALTTDASCVGFAHTRAIVVGTCEKKRPRLEAIRRRVRSSDHTIVGQMEALTIAGSHSKYTCACLIASMVGRRRLI